MIDGLRARLSSVWNNLPLHTKGLIVMAIPLGMLVLTSVCYDLVERQSEQAYAVVDRTFAARAVVNSALANLSHAHAEIANYPDTRDPHSLVDYRQSRAAAIKDLARFEMVEQSIPAGGGTARRIQALADAGLRNLAALHHYALVHSGAPPLALARQTEASMDALRHALEVLQDTEDRFLVERRRRADALQRRSYAVILVSIGCGLACGMLATLLFTAGIARRIQVLEENSRRLAQGLPLLHRASAARDVIGQLERGLETASQLLAQREGTLRETNAELRTEIQERQQAEAALRQTARENSQLAAAVTNLSTGVLITDPALPDNPIVFANPGFCAITGYAVEEVVGRNCRFLQGPDTDSAVVQALRAAIAAPQTVQAVLLNYRRDGTPFWNELTLSPIFDQAGQLANFVGLTQDITAQKQAETALRASEERFRQFAEHIDAVFWMIAPDGNQVLYTSPAYETIWGRSREELEANPWIWIEAVHPDDREHLQPLVQRVASRETFQDEYRIVRPDDSVRWIKSRGFPIHDAQGQLYRIAGISEDITLQKEAEAAIRLAKDEAERARAEAERANRAKSEFLSRMSHELRTPLNAILGFGQLLEFDALTPTQQESVEHILKGGRHLLDLINEVLDIARIEAGRMTLSLEPVALRDVLGETLALVRPLAAARQIQVTEPESQGVGMGGLADSLSHNLDDNLDDNLYVRADRQRLKQVLLNLLSNAIKYNRDGGRVTVACQAGADHRLQVEVRDTGPGIPAEQLGRLFVPFERLDAEQTRVEGTGLGLALSQKLIEAMGGSLGVSSVVGTGSSFWFELPLAPSPLQGHQDIEDARPAAQAVSPPHTVLYIEDNLSNLQLVERLLARRLEARLLTAMQGSVGLELARQLRPDLILLDLHLPDISGHDVLLRLRAEPTTRDIPVVVLSADATPGQIQRLLGAGARAYLTKPLDVRRFLHVLDETLQEVQASGQEVQASG